VAIQKIVILNQKRSHYLAPTITLVLFIIIILWSKISLWPDIIIIMELNKEAAQGNPRPEDLKNAYISLIGKLATPIAAAVLFTSAYFMLKKY